MKHDDTPRIYVASLSDYNAGTLHGTWIDLEPDMSADEIMEQIESMLADSNEPYAEEWAIHDHEDCSFFGEYASLADIEAFCEVWNGYNLDVIKAIADNNSFTEALDIVAEERYTIWASRDDIIDSWIEMMEVPEHVSFYLDEQAIWRDLSMDCTYIELDDGCYIELHR